MYPNFVFLDQFLFELSCKKTHTHTNTETHTHTDSNEYPIVAFSKNATITTAISLLFWHPHMSLIWSFSRLPTCDMLPPKTRESFSRKNIVAISFFQDCAIHPYS